MTPEAQARFDALLQAAPVEQLDWIITLHGVPCPQPQLRAAWAKAVDTGKAWRAQYWDDTLDREANLLALGLARLRTMSPVEEMAWRARALYDPNTFEIAVSQSRIDELAQAFSEYGYTATTSEDIWQILVEHEAFHHIEETREKPLDEKLAAELDIGVFPQLRDIGAHAFANAAAVRPPCQLLDLVWMKINAPVRLKKLLLEESE